DVFPALALAVEAPDPEIMARPPDDPSASLLSPSVLTGIGVDAAFLAMSTLGAYGVAVARHGAGPPATTVALSTLTSAQLLHAFQHRARGDGAFGLAPSPMLSSVVAGSLALQLGTLVVPPLRRLLGLTVPLAGDWALIAGGAVAPLLVNELRRIRQ